jgi:hypothetical protein
VVPFEFNEPMEKPPAGSTWRVLVAGFAGIPLRLRCPVALPVFRLNESFSQEELASLFDQIVPDQFRKLPAFLKRKVEERDREPAA